MKTTLTQNTTNTDRKWYTVDASQHRLGILAVALANTLSGRNKTDYTPHADNGDYVIVTNIEKIQVSGNKETNKNYYRHSGYIGNLKTSTLARVREQNPRKILEEAVSGMLPKTKLRSAAMKRLKLIIGDQHTYKAQKPTPLSLT